MIKVDMKRSEPVRVSGLSNNTGPIYEASKLNALSSQNLSRKQFDQSVSGQNSNSRLQSGGYGMQQPQNRPGNQPGGYGMQQPQNRPGNQPGGYGMQQPQNRPGNQPGGYGMQQPQNQSAPARRRPPLPAPARLLKKGEKYSLTRNNPDVKSFRVGIGWDYSTNVIYDVDIEAFLLNENEKVPDDSWIVFYGQLSSPDRSVNHRGDSSSGVDLGADCEQIDVDLGKLSTEISKIAFVVTINEAKLHGYNFSGMKNAYIRLSDNRTGKEIIRYELTDYYREVVSMVVGEMYYKNGEWRFNPVGMGTGDDLEGLCGKYGIEVV